LKIAIRAQRGLRKGVALMLRLHKIVKRELKKLDMALAWKRKARQKIQWLGS